MKQVILYFLLLGAVTACLPLDPSSSDGGSFPEPPHWAWLDRFTLSAESGDDRGRVASLASYQKPTFVCNPPCRKEGKRVAVWQVPLNQINQAIISKQPIHETFVADVVPDARGFLPRVQITSFYSEPIVLAVTEEPIASGLTISEEGLQTSRAVVFIPGDANLDGWVDMVDLQIVIDHFNGATPADVPWQFGDFNGDGYVDAFDFAVVNGNLNTGLPFRLK